MDWLFIVLRQLGESSAPALPHAATLKIALAIFWAVVLAGAALFLSSKVPDSWPIPIPRPWLLGVLVGLWALWPGPLSPTYWLGLAFQLPSWTTVLVCTYGIVRQVTAQNEAETRGPPTVHSAQLTMRIWTISSILIGWVLLVDSFALFGASVYHWGFGASAVAVLVGAALVPLLIWGGGRGWSWESAAVMALPLAAITLFVSTRLPTGNVWDALLDPWLWVALQGRWIWVRRQSRSKRHQGKLWRGTPVIPSQATTPD